MSSLMTEYLCQVGGIAVFEGGLAIELQRHGADLNGPLWCAKCLLTSPHPIRWGLLDILAVLKYKFNNSSLLRRDMAEKFKNSAVMNKIKLDNGERYVRADKINFKTWDQLLDKNVIRVPMMERKKQMEDEKWQIDSSKLSIRSVIGEGGFGTVYFGNYDGEKVAVKLLKRGEDAVKKALFRQEVSIWHELNHPNVTKFLGASVENSNVEILLKDTSRDDLSPRPSKAFLVVLEYVPGGTLKKFLENHCKERQRLSLPVVIRLALDLSRGLSYLHSKKIVHRDVKTDNMLLDYQNNLKITDFGVARLEAQNPSDMTGKTGTPIYMAPENLRPKIPRSCPREVANIMRKCWDADPENGPEMDEVVRLLEAIDPSKVKPDKPFGCWSFL